MIYPCGGATALQRVMQERPTSASDLQKMVIGSEREFFQYRSEVWSVVVGLRYPRRARAPVGRLALLSVSQSPNMEDDDALRRGAITWSVNHPNDSLWSERKGSSPEWSIVMRVPRFVGWNRKSILVSASAQSAECSNKRTCFDGCQAITRPTSLFPCEMRPLFFASNSNPRR